MLQHADIVWMILEFEIADHRAIGRSTRSSKFAFVDLLKHLSLVELDGLLQILLQLFLGTVEDSQLEIGASLTIHHQVIQTAPATFEFWKLGMVHNGRQLFGDRGIK